MKFFKIFLYITYLLFAIFDIYLIVKNGKEEIFLLICSVFFFLIPILSLFWKKQVHHIIYRFAEAIFKKADFNLEYEEDNYKKFDKRLFEILILAYVLLLLDIPIQYFL